MIDKGDFIDNFNDECVSFIMGIENNMSIYDYKSVYINNDNKDKGFIDFSYFIMINEKNFISGFNNKYISLITGIQNNISIYIVEVPNETAPSIQGFAKPPA